MASQPNSQDQSMGNTHNYERYFFDLKVSNTELQIFEISQSGIVIYGRPNQIVLQDLKAGNNIKLDGVGDYINTAQFSHNGEMVVLVIRNSYIQVFNLKKQQLIFSNDSPSNEAIDQAFFTMDDKQIITFSEALIQIYDIQTGFLIGFIDSNYLNYIQRKFFSILLRRSVRKLRQVKQIRPYIVCGDLDFVIRVHKINTKRLYLQLYGHTSHIAQISCNQVVASGSVDRIIVWELKKGKKIRSLYGGRIHIMDTHNEFIVSTCSDQDFILQNMTTGQKRILKTQKSENPTKLLKFSNQGHQIIIGRLDGTIEIVDVNQEDFDQQ